VGSACSVNAKLVEAVTVRPIMCIDRGQIAPHAVSQRGQMVKLAAMSLPNVPEGKYRGMSVTLTRSAKLLTLPLACRITVRE
jgi:hypothetical protein